MGKRIKYLLLSLLVSFFLISIIRNYVIDLFGISISGIYECKYKSFEDIAFSKSYNLLDVDNFAKKNGYYSRVNFGFGEPDEKGAGIHIRADIEGRKYRVTFGRDREPDWQKFTLQHVISDNGCVVAINTFRNDIIRILNDIGVESEWVKKTRVEYLYHLPWLKFPML